MPDELSKYIHDFIRPIKPNDPETYDDYLELYDYFLNLKLRLNLEFKYKKGMVFKDNTGIYKVVHVTKSYVIVETNGKEKKLN